MSRARPKIHRWMYPFGHAEDPWPGDIARSDGLLGTYRFDGQSWLALDERGTDG